MKRTRLGGKSLHADRTRAGGGEAPGAGGARITSPPNFRVFPA
jgi:hypothetical protein